MHLLDVHSLHFSFSQVKIQLLDNAMDTPKCIEYVYPGSQKQAIPHPLQLTAHAQFQYFEKRPQFSFLFIFKNPMILMMIFGVGMMYIMPKMMENMDEEQKEQMKKQMDMQKDMQDPSKMLKQLWGDISGDSEVAQKKVKRDKTRRFKREWFDGSENYEFIRFWIYILQIYFVLRINKTETNKISQTLEINILNIICTN